MRVREHRLKTVSPFSHRVAQMAVKTSYNAKLGGCMPIVVNGRQGQEQFPVSLFMNWWRCWSLFYLSLCFSLLCRFLQVLSRIWLQAISFAWQSFILRFILSRIIIYIVLGDCYFGWSDHFTSIGRGLRRRRFGL